MYSIVIIWVSSWTWTRRTAAVYCAVLHSSGQSQGVKCENRTIQTETGWRENIVYVYLKADSISSESLQRDTSTKSLKVKAQIWTVSCQKLSDETTRTPCPEASQTSHRVECRTGTSPFSSYSKKQNKGNQNQSSSDVKTNLYFSLFLTFRPNSSSHSEIFIFILFFFFFLNTVRKCNMKSTITRKIDTSEVCFNKTPSTGK